MTVDRIQAALVLVHAAERTSTNPTGLPRPQAVEHVLRTGPVLSHADVDVLLGALHVQRSELTGPWGAARIELLSPATRGWARCWALIAAKYGSPECLNHGEAWQYMGPAVERAGRPPSHCFRHRCAPGTNERVYEVIAIEPGDFEVEPTQIAWSDRGGV